MNNKIIYFKKDQRIYEAQINGTIKNMTDKVSTNVVVKDMVDKGNDVYGILLFSAKTGWDEEFEVKSLNDTDF